MTTSNSKIGSSLLYDLESFRGPRGGPGPQGPPGKDGTSGFSDTITVPYFLQIPEPGTDQWSDPDPHGIQTFLDAKTGKPYIFKPTTSPCKGYRIGSLFTSSDVYYFYFEATLQRIAGGRYQLLFDPAPLSDSGSNTLYYIQKPEAEAEEVPGASAFIKRPGTSYRLILTSTSPSGVLSHSLSLSLNSKLLSHPVIRVLPGSTVSAYIGIKESTTRYLEYQAAFNITLKPAASGLGYSGCIVTPSLDNDTKDGKVCFKLLGATTPSSIKFSYSGTVISMMSVSAVGVRQNAFVPQLRLAYHASSSSDPIFQPLLEATVRTSMDSISHSSSRPPHRSQEDNQIEFVIDTVPSVGSDADMVVTLKIKCLDE